MLGGEFHIAAGVHLVGQVEAVLFTHAEAKRLDDVVQLAKVLVPNDLVEAMRAHRAADHLGVAVLERPKASVPKHMVV